MFIAYIRSTFITDQTKFIDNCQYGKQIGEFLNEQNKQKRPQAQKPIFLGVESENLVHVFENFGNMEKCSQKVSAKWIIRFPKRAHEVPN